MNEALGTLLARAAARLTTRGLFDPSADSLSARWPGRTEMLWVGQDGTATRAVSLSARDGDQRVHAAAYRARDDAGALLLTRAPWFEMLDVLGTVPPALFDEQARHIGPVPPPVPGDTAPGLMRALAGRGNAVLHGRQCLCIGTTPDRLALNAEVFEKSAMAYVLARASGQRVSEIPAWVRWIAGGRLRRDQKRAARKLADGELPTGTTAY